MTVPVDQGLPSEWHDPKTWVMLYAAIVATSALLLNFRTWFEAGPRLKVNLISDGMVIGGDPQFDETDLIIVNVTNCGRTPVLITNLLLWEMPTVYSIWRHRPTRTFVVADPSLKGYPTNIPSLLEPARIWTGVARNRPDIIPDLHNGHFFIGVCTSHREKPILRRILKRTTNRPADSSKPSP
jgi:hypothetical protein